MIKLNLTPQNKQEELIWTVADVLQKRLDV